MPIPDNLKQTIHLALTHISTNPTLTPTYPPRFPTMNDAKHFVQRHCTAAGYDYGLLQRHNMRPSDPHWIARTVRDRVCFLVAVKAYERGTFGLDEGLPDRGALRDAVESAIPAVLSLIPSWPPNFASADVAAKYIAGVAAMRKHVYPVFEGVGQERFHGYVCWNSARWAWEGEKFELDVRPVGWRREVAGGLEKARKGRKVESMKDAIESDIQRLKTLIPRSVWPASFTDLNTARNFIGKWCWENGFRYAGWPDVEARKYRLFVNFQAARSALEAEVFGVDEEVAKLGGEKGVSGREGAGAGAVEEEEEEEEEEEVSVFALEMPVREKRTHTPGLLIEIECADKAGDYDTSSIAFQPPSPSIKTPRSPSDLDPNTIKPDPGSPPPSFSPAAAEKTSFPSPNAAELHTITLDDPFKDLIAELRRGFTLKAAFD